MFRLGQSAADVKPIAVSWSGRFAAHRSIYSSLHVPWLSCRLAGDIHTHRPRHRDSPGISMQDYAAARFNMVEGQIRPNKVTNAALVDAMMTLPRELFVPGDRRPMAYVDEDLAIGNGRFLMEPMVFARLVNDTAPDKQSVVLDIGCGTGYSAAILARVAGTVVALESDESLAAQATAALKTVGADNAVVVRGPLAAGLAGQGPYDVILIGGAVAEVPEALTAQLAEGGRLAAIVAPRAGLSRATLFEKVGGVVSRRELFDAASPYLVGFEPQAGFTF
jgi:protein-L-isoaspartate(D-aspartate) O-methyltransferase